MPAQRHFITPISGVEVRDVFELNSRIFILGRALIPPDTQCPGCQARCFRIKATRLRRFNHAMWGQKLVRLELKIPKLLCKPCGRYFMVRVPGILPKKRSTEQFRQEIFQLHQGGIAQTQLKLTHQISASSVERWYQDFVDYRVKELSGRQCPLVLGIDEHFFSRKHGYATTLVDLRNHKVFDVVLGRSEDSLKHFLKKLPGRERVQVVVMDLSETYRSIVKKYFPNAMIVADRFHVIRLLNHHFLKTWQSFHPEGRKNRGLLSLMRRHAWNLAPDQRVKLESYFEQYPGLKILWEFKQDLTEILLKKHLRKVEAKALIPQFLWHLNECIKSPFESMKAFGKTLRSWAEPIVRMWRFSKSNGITEGLHTKMEMISRRAFGFRNFKNYRLRVIALCGWNGVFKIRN
jgi:transposase